MEDTIGFWGEWEPESRTELVDHPVESGPRYLHYPYYSAATAARSRGMSHACGSGTAGCDPCGGDGDRDDEGVLQNTDPFVFGDRFLYALCMQNGANGPTRLRYLERGSVLLFGSNLGGSFILDTLFVVADYHEYRRPGHHDFLGGAVDREYEEVTLNNVPDGEYRLYIGATAERPFNGMYSFVPCMPHASAPAGFARPVIGIEGAISPGLSRGKRYLPERSMEELEDLWRTVVQQVEEQGLKLGVRVDLPGRRP